MASAAGKGRAASPDPNPLVRHARAHSWEESLDHRHGGVVMTGTRRLSAAKSKSLFALLAAVGALAATYSKAPAEAALKAADQAVASARTEGEKFAPQQLEALLDAARSAHDRFDHRDYAAAKAWGDLQAQVPAMGDTIRARVDEMAAMKKLPKGFDVERLEHAKAGLAAFDQAWGGAAAAAHSGDVISAVEKGRATRAKALELINALGLPSPAAAASEPPPPATK
jgi:hypothetical protein